MEAVTAIALGIPLGMGFVVLGCGISLGMIVGRAIEAMARQPELEGVIKRNAMQAIAVIGFLFLSSFVGFCILYSKMT